MAGLNFEQLPGQRTEAVAPERRVSPESVAKEFSEPRSIIDSDYKRAYSQLESRYNTEAKSLEQAYLSDEDFMSKLEQLKIKYEGMTREIGFERNRQSEELERLDGFVSRGMISPEEAEKARWKLVLPDEVERAMFPSGVKDRPLAIGTLTGKAMSESISGYAMGADDKPGMEWGAPKKDTDSLIEQYKTWRDNIGYDYVNHVQQKQLDMQWDSFMRGGKQFSNWWTDDKKKTTITDIQALRSSGRISDAMSSRVTGMSRISQIARSVIQDKPVKPVERENTRNVIVETSDINPSANQLKAQGTEEAYEKGKKLGYWE